MLRTLCAAAGTGVVACLHVVPASIAIQDLGCGRLSEAVLAAQMHHMLPTL